jgi:hypothetical protein
MRRAMAVAVLLALVGCSDETGGGGAAASDCQSQVRYEGTVYTGYASTDLPGTKLGKADMADCDDMGEDAQGSVFGEDPDQVEVWSIEGYSPDEVIGLRDVDDSVSVYFAESLSTADIERISRELD